MAQSFSLKWQLYLPSAVFSFHLVCISVLCSKHFFEIPTILGLRSVLCSPCIMCPAGHYPPQHKQAGLQIQRNTNRNTASDSGEMRIQQIQSPMGSTESLCFPHILMSSFEGSWDTLFMRESRTIPLLTMPALSHTYIQLYAFASRGLKRFLVFNTATNNCLTVMLSGLSGRIDEGRLLCCPCCH